MVHSVEQAGVLGAAGTLGAVPAARFGGLLIALVMVAVIAAALAATVRTGRRQRASGSGTSPPDAQRQPGVSRPDPTVPDHTTQPRPVESTAAKSLHAQTPRATADPTDDEYGLLTPAATVAELVDAELLRAHLRSAGIRATIATAPGGGHRILVFREDLREARRVVGRS